ncbi:MAG: alpha/beta hydrolase [Ruminococcaceae bacterium]|nr:alpha/beta hydrolase [Oscillospiraceae bacterium]
MEIFTRKIEINGQSVDLHAYIPEPIECAVYHQKRPAVIVFPGGAYRGTAQHEGEPIALQYVAAGACAFVLKYSVYPARFPQALLEAFESIRYVREHAEEFCIDPCAISVCGFSAGGHLAGCTGTLWNHAFFDGLLEKDRHIYRPDSLILCYPVIGDRFHHNSMLNLFEKNEDELTEDCLQLLELETQVDEQTPPTFLWHNFGDTGVPCEASLCFASALYRHGVPCELHLYSEGKHGCALGTYVTGKFSYRNGMVCESWMKLSVDFIYRFYEQSL